MDATRRETSIISPPPPPPPPSPSPPPPPPPLSLPLLLPLPPALRLPLPRALPAPALFRHLTQAGSPIATAVRLALLLLATLLALVTGADQVALTYLVSVLALGIVASLLPEGSRLQLPLLLAEAALVSTGVVAAGPQSIPLLACLPSTVLAAGLGRGYPGILWTGGMAAVVLLVGRAIAFESPAAARTVTQASAAWLVVALTTGFLGARIGQLSMAKRDPEPRYVEAYRLLAELRNVTRRLPGSLDPGSVARTLLEKCVAEVRCEHGAVLLEVGGDQLVPLALHGYQRVPWRASLDDDGPIARAWLSRAPVLDQRRRDGARGGARRGSVLLALAMTVDDHFVGVVALETRQPGGFPPEQVETLRALVRNYELPLETAALFDELRMGAANEERSRLAREMHDGIAQDLASLGYSLDAVTATLRHQSAEEALPHARALRQRITDLIGDLRLSMTDLRSSVGPGRGLGAALSEYARAVGTSTGMTVHLSLTEGSTRLPADTEVQLLRIAHEAILRARRRVGTTNLWVTLTVDPPLARLVVEDDGAEAGAAAEDRTGLEVMTERAGTLGAVFKTEPRVPRGTRTCIDVGGT